MNILLVPALVSLVAVGLLVLCVAAGMVLQQSQSLASVGRALRWYSFSSLCMAIICAWIGPFTLAAVLGLALGEWGFLFGLWASGPIGLLMGLAWARRHPGGQDVRQGKPLRWGIVGGIAFVLLGLGLWFTWQASNAAAPPDHRLGFGLWLARILGLK
jgi:hypothetical protein